jgi:hypothetical protein
MDRFLYINSLLSTPNGLANSKVEILKASIEFVTAFEHPSTPVGEKGVLDEMRPILSSLRDSTCPAELELRFASIMKILLRKAVNRDNIGKFGMSSIVQCIGRQQLIGSLAAAELGNVVLNACFDSQNVMLYLGENGLPPLLNLLRCPDSAVQASVLGALQGICFTPAGKYSLRSKDEAIAKIMMFMISDNMTVRARAVGTIHNLSADPVAISAIRELNNYSGIPMLISLLHDPSPELCHAAAGALQNLSRDNTARKIIVSIPEALPRLIDLLFGSDVKCQVRPRLHCLLMLLFSHSHSVLVPFIAGGGGGSDQHHGAHAQV